LHDRCYDKACRYHWQEGLYWYLHTEDSERWCLQPVPSHLFQIVVVHYPDGPSHRELGHGPRHACRCFALLVFPLPVILRYSMLSNYPCPFLFCSSFVGTIGYVNSGEKYCVDVAGGFFAPGALTQLWNCQNSNPTQQWNYRDYMMVWAPMDGSGAPPHHTPPHHTPPHHPPRPSRLLSYFLSVIDVNTPLNSSPPTRSHTTQLKPAHTLSPVQGKTCAWMSLADQTCLARV
jgi:hypothetical protein